MRTRQNSTAQIAVRYNLIEQDHRAVKRRCASMPLNQIAQRRGQSLAQMALAWVLRKSAITSALIGASRWSQIEECLGALKNLQFSQNELQDIDQHAVDSGLNIWAGSSQSR
jgi:L-glyceraldehyde 3-phosphate reductase